MASAKSKPPAVTPTFVFQWGSLINIGLKRTPVVASSDDTLVNLHRACAEQGQVATLKETKVCSVCGGAVPADQIVKAYLEGGAPRALFTTAEVKELQKENDKAMPLVAFVPWEQIDVSTLGLASYLAPADIPTERAYAMFRDGMKQASRVALVRYTWYGHDTYGVIRPEGDHLILHQCAMPAKMNAFESKVPITSHPSQEELDLALELIERDLADFSTDGWADSYIERRDAFIKARLEGATPVPMAPEAAPAAPPVDLLAALKASIAAAPKKPGAKAAEKKKPTSKEKAA